MTEDWCSEERKLAPGMAATVEMKHQVVHALQKYVLNPRIKGLFSMGIVPPGYALLGYGWSEDRKARRTPVGDARVGKQFWIVAEHGVKAGYVRNIKENPRVRLFDEC